MAYRKTPSVLTVTALDAARREIETAITLWFQDGDEVSIHTLTAAGHHVCHDLAKKKGMKSPFFFNMDLVKPEFHDEYKQIVCRAENFFKHAQRTTNARSKLTFCPEVTDAYLLDALELFHMLHGSSTPLMMAFRLRFTLSHPETARGDVSQIFDDPTAVKLGRLTKVKFLEAFLKALELRRGK